MTNNQQIKELASKLLGEEYLKLNSTQEIASGFFFGFYQPFRVTTRELLTEMLGKKERVVFDDCFEALSSLCRKWNIANVEIAKIGYQFIGSGKKETGVCIYFVGSHSISCDANLLSLKQLRFENYLALPTRIKFRKFLEDNGFKNIRLGCYSHLWVSET